MSDDDLPLGITTRRVDRPEDSDDDGSARRHADAGPLNYARGMAWTGGMRRYIGDLVPTQLEEARRDWREWWRDEYIVKRLAATLPEEPLLAVLRYLSTDLEARHDAIPEILRASGHHTPRWLFTWKARIVRQVRRLYLAHEDFPNPRRRRAPTA